MRRIYYFAYVVGLSLLAGCAEPEPTAPPSPRPAIRVEITLVAPTLAPPPTWPSLAPPTVDLVAAVTTQAARKRLDQVKQAAQQAFVERTGVVVDEVTVVEAEPMVWPDTCLGLPLTGCQALPVEGYRVTLSYHTQRYVCRTDLFGTKVFLQP
jgi:hypothetical protein